VQVRKLEACLRVAGRRSTPVDRFTLGPLLVVPLGQGAGARTPIFDLEFEGRDHPLELILTAACCRHEGLGPSQVALQSGDLAVLGRGRLALGPKLSTFA
jgi:hypothetical protein